MNRTEHLLTIMAEECNEVAQRISKALRFGLEEKQEGQEFTNAERIEHEMADLLTVRAMLTEGGALREPKNLAERCLRKLDKVECYLRYSVECGTFQEEV